MAKQPRSQKKRKVAKNVKRLQSLGTSLLDRDPLTDDELKDDEERKLESILFGKKVTPRDEGNTILETYDDQSGVAVGADTGNTFDNLLDSDLFFVDGGDVTSYKNKTEEGESTSDALKDSHDQDEDDHPDAESSSSSSISPKAAPLSSKRKPPVWIDPSDPPAVSLSAPRLRKLRDAPGEETLSGREYEARLRRQFERINPEPDWAKKARSTTKKQHAQDEIDEQDSREGGIQQLLASTDGILKKRDRKGHGRKVVLEAGTIEVERLRDANLASQGTTNGEIKVVQFHPSDRVPVLCVGSTDRRVRLFNIDGHTNPLLQTLHVPSLPFTSQTCVSFHPLGSSILLAGPRPFFYTHDLQSGITTRHARGLWGTSFNDTFGAPIVSRKRHRDGGRDNDTSGVGNNNQGMEITAFSPNTGDVLAVAGRGGYVHLVDWKSGAGQVIGSLKCSGSGGGVRGMWWVPPRHNDNNIGLVEETGEGRKELAVLTGDSEVYIWDVGTRRCLRRWKDEGGFRSAGKVLAGSTSFLAIGSNVGFVNVYAPDSFSPPFFDEQETMTNPKPLKSIGNLTTSISTIRFSHDSQLMAIASQEKKDAMRLIHTPTLTSFANWPTSSTPLGHVTAIDFAPKNEYVAIGNTRGRVLLYHLKAYGVND